MAHGRSFEKGGCKMLVRVMSKDGEFCLVNSSVLTKLIYAGKVLKFYRSGQWVVVGHDPVRGMGGSGTGYRRRSTDH
jgi:hypothetical protein